MGLVLLHAQLGVAEVVLLLVNVVAHLLHLLAQLHHHLGEVVAEPHARVFHKRFLQRVEACVFLHQQRLAVEVVGIGLAVAAELLVDDLGEEGGQVLLVLQLGAVVAQQRAQRLAVGGSVPGVAVVLEADVLSLAVTHGCGAVVGTQGSRRELVGAAEGLSPEHIGPHDVDALAIELFHLLEVELAAEVARLLLPFLQLRLEGGLVLDESDAVDALVHADGVLPVVARLGILRVVLDAHGL